MSSKKKEQLGMNPSTASHRLIKDILWKLVVECGYDECHCCGEKMNRDDFSIEHKIPWMDSENPVELFFDLDNISFSHLRCNVSAARRKTIDRECGHPTKYDKGCRCKLCTDAKTAVKRQYYTPESRRERYQRTGN